MMTTKEFYKAFIETQKRTGQGTSGIVKVFGGSEIARHLDELIEEGLCVAMDTGGSLGHPESNIFYMPAKGYNVWQEENSQASLECVRYYLAEDKESYQGDPFIGIDRDSFEAEDGILREFYAEWLERNREALEEMLSLSEEYESQN